MIALNKAITEYIINKKIRLYFIPFTVIFYQKYNPTRPLPLVSFLRLQSNQ